MFVHAALLIANILHIIPARGQSPDPQPGSLAQPQPTLAEPPQVTVSATQSADDNDDECLSSAIELAEHVPTPTNMALVPAIESFLSSAGQVRSPGQPPQPTLYCEAVVAMPDGLRSDYMSWEAELQSWCTAHTASMSALATKCPVAWLDPLSGFEAGLASGDGIDGGEIGDGSAGWKGDGSGIGMRMRVRMAGAEDDGGRDVHLTAIDCDKMNRYIEGGCTGAAPYTVSAAAERTPEPVPVAAAVAGLAGLMAAW